jgi:hypothetical protein
MNIYGTLMNIWVVRFDFDMSHIFVDSVTSPTNIGGRAIGCGPPIFIGYSRIQKLVHFFPSLRSFGPRPN